MLTYLWALIILAIVLAAHLLGLTGLYVTFFWYDIMMHILGGVGIGLFVTAIVNMHFPAIVNRRRFIIVSVVIVGIVWELFEAYYDIAGYRFGTKLYYLDTIKDLIDDTIGASLVAYWVTRNKNK